MTKKEGAAGFFDDGLTFVFRDADGEITDQRPTHIHFEVRTETPENKETCDLRLYSVAKKAQEEAPESGRLLQADDNEPPQQGDPPTAEEPAPASEDAGEQAEAATEEQAEFETPPVGPSGDYEKVAYSDVALFRLGYYNMIKMNT